MRQFFEVLTSIDLDLWPFQSKIGTPLIRALGNIRTNFGFSVFFCFRLQARTGQTDRRARHVMRLIGRPHNEVFLLKGTIYCGIVLRSFLKEHVATCPNWTALWSLSRHRNVACFLKDNSSVFLPPFLTCVTTLPVQNIMPVAARVFAVK